MRSFFSFFLFLGPGPLSLAQRARHVSRGCGRNISLNTEIENSRLHCGDLLIILQGRNFSRRQRVKECSTSMKSCDTGHVPGPLLRGLHFHCWLIGPESMKHGESSTTTVVQGFGEKLRIILEKFSKIFLKLIKKNRKMSTYNRLDLETLGSRPNMPKNLPGHWPEFITALWSYIGLHRECWELMVPPPL